MISTTEIASAEIASDKPIHERLLYAYVVASDKVKGDLLEIGCGEGRGMAELQAKVKSYTAIDKIQAVIDTLSVKYPNVKFNQGNIPPLSMYADNSFDTIVTFQVIEHIKNDHLFLKEANRVLRPGGQLILTTPNIKMTLTRNPWHIREYTVKELNDIMSKYFNTVDIQGIYGNEKVMDYYEQNKASVKRITRFDIFGFQHWLPNALLRIPYEILNRMNRNKLMTKNESAVEDISSKDFNIKKADDQALDLFAIAVK